ncbi:MAG TPA: protocatechuate 3,4-dioxygenase [Alphaproteobacteria bacterium]
MARLVAAFGTSHSIMLNSTLDDWLRNFRVRDRTLSYHDRSGRALSYDEALALAPPDAALLITPARLEERHAAAHANIARMKAEIAAARLDALVVIGDDQHELFDERHQPSIGIYHGTTIRNAAAADAPGATWFERARSGFQEPQADAHYPCDAALALHLIDGLVTREFDIAAINGLAGGQFEGHAYGFVHRRYIGAAGMPVVPVFLNTYYPPNQPTPRRCVELGRAIAELVASYPKDIRIGVIGSGGLTHFLIDAEFDQDLIAAFRRNDLEFLARLDPRRLQSGSSEIRNWLVAAGTAQSLALQWASYVPGYRSPALSGTGLCWAAWR